MNDMWVMGDRYPTGLQYFSNFYCYLRSLLNLIFTLLLFKVKKVPINIKNLTEDDEQQKPIFGSTSKVLCLTGMSICLSICLLN